MLWKSSSVALGYFLFSGTTCIVASADQATAINIDQRSVEQRHLKHAKKSERKRKADTTHNKNLTPLIAATEGSKTKDPKVIQRRKKKMMRREKRRKRKEQKQQNMKDLADAEDNQTSSPSTTTTTQMQLSCPKVVDESIKLDNGAILHYVLVPSNPQGSDNGLLCGRLRVANHEGWVGLAISESGGMVGSQAIVGVPGDEGTVLKYDLAGYGGIKSMSNNRQTLRNTSIELRNGKTVMEFTKLLVEDGEMAILEEGVNIFLYARGGNTLGHHSSRLSFAMDFGDDLH